MIELTVPSVVYRWLTIVRNIKKILGAYFLEICDLFPIIMEYIRKIYSDSHIFTVFKYMMRKDREDTHLTAKPAHIHFSFVKDDVYHHLRRFVEKFLAIKSRQTPELKNWMGDRSLILIFDHTFLHINYVQKFLNTAK